MPKWDVEINYELSMCQHVGFGLKARMKYGFIVASVCLVFASVAGLCLCLSINDDHCQGFGAAK